MAGPAITGPGQNKSFGEAMMYNANKITEKVTAGKMALGSHVAFDSPFITEMIAGCGFDFIWIDSEHCAIDRKDIQNHLMACRAAGAAGIVRVPWNDPVSIKAILDMGADGIVVPMVCSLEEARQAAAATHYPPAGIRGMGTRRAVNYGLWDKNEYVTNMDKYVLTIVQIEHINVVKDLPEIAKLPGISGFVVGPNDFCMSMNTFTRTYNVNDPEVQEQFDKIGEALKDSGKLFGVSGVYSEKFVADWARRGVNFMTMNFDFHYIISGAKGVISGVHTMLDTLEKSY